MNAAHIILEGPDGAGKTTLATRLCTYGYAYRHEGPPPMGTTALRHYAGILARLERPTLLDRFHLGELVYGPLLRGRSGLSEEGLRLLRRVLHGLGIRVVLCLPPFPIAFRNWSIRNRTGGEFFQDAAVFEASFERFAQLRDHVHDVIDFTRPHDLEPLVAPLPACLPGVFGSPHARVVFVGSCSHQPVDWPFIAEHGCSAFLNRAIQGAGFTEEEVAFTKTEHHVDLRARIQPGQTIVAIGRLAERAVKVAGLTAWFALPHPHRPRPLSLDRYISWLAHIRRDPWRVAS